MPKFSKKSQERLATCAPDLQRLFNEVIKERDCTVLCGHRTKEEQDEAVRGGFSKTPFPKSKHNPFPSLAVDVVPYPIDWNNKQRFIEFHAYVKLIAAKLEIKIRWGGDWDNDGDWRDERFLDMPHYELVL